MICLSSLIGRHKLTDSANIRMSITMFLFFATIQHIYSFPFFQHFNFKFGGDVCKEHTSSPVRYGNAIHISLLKQHISFSGQQNQVLPMGICVDEGKGHKEICRNFGFITPLPCERKEWTETLLTQIPIAIEGCCILKH
jgi:hypothetical protein